MTDQPPLTAAPAAVPTPEPKDQQARVATETLIGETTLFLNF